MGVGNIYYAEYSATQSFTVGTTATRRKLTTLYGKEGIQSHPYLVPGDNRLEPVNYIRIANHTSKTLYCAFNGGTASSSLATGAAEPTATPNFRIHPYSIREWFTKATSVNVLSSGAGTGGTAIYIETARF